MALNHQLWMQMSMFGIMHCHWCMSEMMIIMWHLCIKIHIVAEYNIKFCCFSMTCDY